MFKKYFLCTALLLMAFSVKVFPSGIQVLNTTVTTNQDKKSAQVKFTLTWDHSWRLASGDGPANWDAAWVFVKYRTIPGDNWSHAYISTTLTTHKIPSNAEIKVGTSPLNSVTYGVGAFIYRKDTGNGTVSFQDIELNWAFTLNGLSGGEQVEVCVLATEMVYISPGNFYVGDYGASTGSFKMNTSGEPFLITSALPVYGTGTYSGGRIGAYGTVGDDFYAGTGNGYGTLVASWPRGFEAFYCMKYEITQGEYVQFLNKVPVSVKNTGTYWQNTTANRYSIVKKAGTGIGTIPAEYELSAAGAAFLPCNYLGTKDILAWLVWAGLRPMTELEYEKVCRGPANNGITTIAADRPAFAWGRVDFNNMLGFVNKGMNNEGPSNSEANCAFAPTTVNSNANMDGPIRAGGFATPVSSRTKAGASYYGVMEMSGNLRERCVTLGLGGAYNVNTRYGRMYTGLHGNGEIGVGSTPECPTYWPTVTEQGLGFRGGSFWDLKAAAQISDRSLINQSDHARKANFGGRGVRSVSSLLPLP